MDSTSDQSLVSRCKTLRAQIPLQALFVLLENCPKSPTYKRSAKISHFDHVGDFGFLLMGISCRAKPTALLESSAPSKFKIPYSRRCEAVTLQARQPGEVLCSDNRLSKQPSVLQWDSSLAKILKNPPTYQTWWKSSQSLYVGDFWLRWIRFAARFSTCEKIPLHSKILILSPGGRDRSHSKIPYSRSSNVFTDEKNPYIRRIPVPPLRTSVREKFPRNHNDPNNHYY